MRGTWNPHIHALEREHERYEAEYFELNRTIDYYYLQQRVCIDKIFFYEAEQDAFKTWYWEDLEERVDSLCYEARNKRDEIFAAKQKIAHQIIELMTKYLKQPV